MFKDQGEERDIKKEPHVQGERKTEHIAKIAMLRVKENCHKWKLLPVKKTKVEYIAEAEASPGSSSLFLAVEGIWGGYATQIHEASHADKEDFSNDFR